MKKNWATGSKKFFITGFDITATFKYKNVKTGNELVPLVIDNLASVQPRMARGIKIHGKAEIVEADGRASLIIHPQRLWSWGVDDVAFKDGKSVSRKAKQGIE